MQGDEIREKVDVACGDKHPVVSKSSGKHVLDRRGREACVSMTSSGTARDLWIVGVVACVLTLRTLAAGEGIGSGWSTWSRSFWPRAKVKVIVTSVSGG